jgi:glutamate synthase domain-containing protein 1/glutamate synthase domain-containing protein 3
MTGRDLVERMLASRGHMLERFPGVRFDHGREAEGGCGVIGIACSEPIPGRHLLQSLRQMRNRGNGKGGGAALAGLDPGGLGVTPSMLRDDFLLTVAYLDGDARREVETSHIVPVFEIDHVHTFPRRPPDGLEPTPPLAVGYFVRVREDALSRFVEANGLEDAPVDAVEEEFVYQNSFQLNSSYYASLGEQRAFVLSHGKDMLALKMVGYGDDVIQTYGLDSMLAHVWIGHHRYPTKGKVWHPGGAHPFVGMHEALVHNGDFANYASVCAYLAQHNIEPLFLTDTEVSVLVFDLLHRTFGYPLEYVIEALAPTTERDFTMLAPGKQAIYRRLQAAHIHGSPDGPWFFLIAQSADAGESPRAARLIGITDTSMLRPQVFALQRGEAGMPSVGLAASEKQAIDAALGSLSAEDARFWTRPDALWVARGGSHTDGGAFLFEVRRDGERPELVCTDKFGAPVEAGTDANPYRGPAIASVHAADAQRLAEVPLRLSPERVAGAIAGATYQQAAGLLRTVGDRAGASPDGRERALALLTWLLDRRYPLGGLRRSSLLSLIDQTLTSVFESIPEVRGDGARAWRGGTCPAPSPSNDGMIVIDGSGFAPEGERSLSRAIVEAAGKGHRRIVVWRTLGHRFIGSGLGREGEGVRLDVFGSPGDYLASGIDGVELVVHSDGQDQMAQIMRKGKLVVHGDVGQTFMYGAKGGEAYVLGSAAGRPLINAVGSPRVVINGTCLDYLAESFMAGDPLHGGGFVVMNGVRFDCDGGLRDLDSPYPGGNLFSLASGGAIFVRDPRGMVGPDQLNGGAIVPFADEYWDLVRPVLEENERLFGITIERLLTVDGHRKQPGDVYRAILPVRQQALQPEQAWVAKH